MVETARLAGEVRPPSGDELVLDDAPGHRSVRLLVSLEHLDDAFVVELGLPADLADRLR
jgi:hypothetical protein